MCHRQRLFEKSLRRVQGNRADAEDAMSTAMLRALESFPLQSSRLDSAEAWLTRILHNTCVDLHRKRRFQVDAALEEDGAPSEELVPGEALSPEQLLLQQEQAGTLRRQLAALPEPLRQPCAMRFEQGMSYEEIAQALGLTQVNVRRRIMLSYRHLRAAFAGSA
jgi:RNA polymerase sigma-70 factor (ECF subfamily)